MLLVHPYFEKLFYIRTSMVPRFASAVTWSRGPRSWHGFTHGPPITDNCPIGCDQTKTQAWPWNGEGGMARNRSCEAFRRLSGSTVHGGPVGWGRVERPRKYSPVRREASGTSTVVRGKGEGVGGTDRDGNNENRGESRASKIQFCPGQS